MFNWFRRHGEPKRPERAVPRLKAQPEHPSQSAQRQPVHRRPAGAPDAALPEVVAEGNTEADWSAWEDSRAAWDSQLQGLTPSDRVHVRDEARPGQRDEVDAFASVGRKRHP